MLANPFVAFQFHPIPKYIPEDIYALRIEPSLFKYYAEKAMSLTSISARGVRAETESMQMRSTAPDLQMRSATETQKTKDS